MNTNQVLLDADSMVYIAAWDVKELDNTPENYATVIAKTDKFIADVLTACNANSYIGFLKGSQPTFRHEYNSDYKANRKTGTNEWLNKWDAVIKHRMISYWSFNQVEGMEAEDAVSILANAYLLQNLVIAHIDKDLMQIPGMHYDYKKQLQFTVSQAEAADFLAKQIIIGDSVDNLPGLPGAGKVFANTLIDGNRNNDAQFFVDPLHLAMDAFRNKLGEREGIIKFTESYFMVKLITKPEMGFDPSYYSWNLFTPLPVTEADTVDKSKYDEQLFSTTNLDSND